MTLAEFKKKWARFSGKESSAYQSHFNDLCAILNQPSPVSADPTGSETFCFQKRVMKDAELFIFGEDGTAETDEAERGFADVWKKGCFAWEYKGKKKNLDAAYRQLLRYRESLENPPLLVVCDFDRYIIRTNFNGTVQETHEFTNAQLEEPHNLRLLRSLFTDPEFLRPTRTTAQVTEEVAAEIAAVARSLQGRESVEYQDAKTRREQNVAQRKNLRIARFLNRIIFCFFAEDVGLLPKGMFTEVTKAGLEDTHFFAERLGALFNVMATGGSFGVHKIRHFNGHLFEEATVFELTEEEISALAQASEADWQFIEPSILGTLFERGLDPDQRAQLGAHYTSRTDIETLVEPVLMAPLRSEWKELKRKLLDGRGKASAAHKQAVKKQLAGFLEKIGSTVVLDPACGSGNFLYVSLQMLLDMEKTVITFAAQLGLKFEPGVDVQQLRAIEINPYAFELAQVSAQIGWLQWRIDNGFPLDRTPVLQTLSGFENADALMREVFHRKPTNLKEARAAEHQETKSEKGYVEKAWPVCSVIVSNPPFLGDKVMRGELGDSYVNALREVYLDRIPGQSDFCCYWFEMARVHIAAGKCKRAGLLATQNIRGLANREVLKRILASGGIFFAESDRPWILDGANVHISMVGFDDGTEKEMLLDGKSVQQITPSLSSTSDIVTARCLSQNADKAFIGSCKGGPFDITEAEAIRLLTGGGNPHGQPNSDVVRPVMNTDDLFKSRVQRWIIDNAGLTLEQATLYEAPHAHVLAYVKPLRDNNRDRWLKENWWRPQRMRPEMRNRIAPLSRFLVTATTAKHQVFVWLAHPTLPDHKLTVFAFDADSEMGVLQSRIHQVWSLRLGTRLETRPNYTPSTCFETFPFPEPRAEHAAAIATTAKELNERRETWLNPPDWTHTEVMEFLGTVGGPWNRHIDPATVTDRGLFKVGTARYPRLVPKDAGCAAKLKGRTLTKLYNERPTWLDLAHKKLDAAVAAAYGWPADLSDDSLLERLLALNLERAKAEQFAGKKKPVVAREKRDDEML
jgi:type II restriction/modification system DNA methylase subunit YeeA